MTRGNCCFLAQLNRLPGRPSERLALRWSRLPHRFWSPFVHLQLTDRDRRVSRGARSRPADTANSTRLDNPRSLYSFAEMDHSRPRCTRNRNRSPSSTDMAASMVVRIDYSQLVRNCHYELHIRRQTRLRGTLRRKLSIPARYRTFRQSSRSRCCSVRVLSFRPLELGRSTKTSIQAR